MLGVSVYLVFLTFLNNKSSHRFIFLNSSREKPCQVSRHELFNGSNFGTMGLAGLGVNLFLLTLSCVFRTGNLQKICFSPEN